MPKKDEEFFETSLDFFVENGNTLQKICPDSVDEYNDHSLLKLISLAYWVGFFSPIAHRQLKEKYGYRIAYVDTMAGSGVTATKRSGDYFCGSCPGALLSARKYPFDLVMAVEIDPKKGDALKRDLKRCYLNKMSQFSIKILLMFLRESHKNCNIKLFLISSLILKHFKG
ncbi:MAG: hypothetical protein IMZ58_02945 [Thermoplasmata archaeon]|nr:hypothetical protein [Thermoplasmata archaeon]